MRVAASARRGAAARSLRAAPRAQFGVPLPPPPQAVAPRAAPLFARPPPLPRTRDPFLLLGLPRDATPASAMAALHVLTLIYHPQHNSDPQAALQFRALEAAAAAVCAGRGSFANPLDALKDHVHDHVHDYLPAALDAHALLHAPADAPADVPDGATSAEKAPAAAGLVCGACGGGTRRSAASFAKAPAFLCRRCHALNVFAAPGVEVHVHAQQRTAAGVLHFITVDRAGCAPPSAADAAACDAEDEPPSTVSFPVFNASRKVVLAPREAFEPEGQGRAQAAPARGADAGGAAVPLLPRRGCAEAARLPPHAPPLVVRLGGDDAGARVFLERPGAQAGAWDELRDRTAPEHLPAFCAAVIGSAHRASNAAAELAR